jgi:tellurite resistance protein
MANLDRPGIVELLGRLGAQDDATVLAAARELHAKVSQSGSTWDELLRANLDVADADAEPEDTLGDEAEKLAEQKGELSAADKAEALRLIDRLLARKTLSSTLREDLADFKRGIADGSFDAMDSRYIRALAKRLGV